MEGREQRPSEIGPMTLIKAFSVVVVVGAAVIINRSACTHVRWHSIAVVA